jgi:hypothetical protein
MDEELHVSIHNIMGDHYSPSGTPRSVDDSPRTPPHSSTRSSASQRRPEDDIDEEKGFELPPSQASLNEDGKGPMISSSLFSE